jgi:HEAT repeat protein
MSEAGGASSVAISEDGKLALSGYDTGTFKLWDLASGKRLRTFGEEQVPVSSRYIITSIRFLPGDKQALVSAAAHWLQVWDLERGRVLRSFKGFEGQTLFAVSPDGKSALSGRRGGLMQAPYALKLWDVATGEPTREITGHEHFLLAATFTSDGRRLLSGSKDGTIRLWEVASGKELWALSVDPRPRSGGYGTAVIAFSRDGTRAVSGGNLGTVKLWDTVNGTFLRLLAWNHEPGTPKDDTVLPALLALLHTGDAQARLNAAQDLGRMGEDVKPAIHSLQAALKHEDGMVRITAAQAIYNIEGQLSADAAAVLCAAVSDPSVAVRRKAAGFLSLVSRVKPQPTGAALAAARALADPDIYVRAHAAQALGYLDARVEGLVPTLIAVLQSEDGLLHRQAAELLKALAENLPALVEPAIPGLSAALRDQDNLVRIYVAETLLRLKVRPEGMVRVLAEALKDEEDGVSMEAARILGRLGPDAKDAVPALIETLKDGSGVGGWAVEALREIGPVTIPAVLEVIKNSQKAEARASAIAVLWSFGPKAREAIPVLIKALKDENWDVRGRSAWVLGTIGPEAESAIPGIVDLLSKDEANTARAAEALASIGPASVPHLIKLLEGNSAIARVGAVSALMQLGPKARDAVPALIEALMDLKDSHYQDRRDFAASTLGLIGSEAKGAIPALAAIVRDKKESPPLRNACLYALANIASAAREALPSIREELKDDPLEIDQIMSVIQKMQSDGAAKVRKP